MATPNYVKSRYSVNDVDWTPIVPTIDSNAFGLKAVDKTVTLLIRTDVNDADSEDTLPPSAQEGVIGGPITKSTENLGWGIFNTSNVRFPKGEPILWVKSTGGVQQVLVTWIG